MTTTTSEGLVTMGKAARETSRTLARLNTAVKDKALANIAKARRTQQKEILDANATDMEGGKRAGLDAAMLDRLMLNPARLEDIAQGVEQVMAIPDPIGEEFDAHT